MKRWLLFFCIGGCSTTMIGRADDQNPFTKPDHISEGIIISFKDPHIIASGGEAVGDSSQNNKGSYGGSGTMPMHPTFHQTAYFQAPNPNQIIFLVELQNRWRELTHAESYTVTLIDDLGRKFLPSDVTSTASHVVWESMSLARADVVHMKVISSSFPGGEKDFKHGESTTGDANENSTMLSARSRIEFRADNVVTPSTKRVTLRLENRNRSLEFVWNFKK